MALLQSLWSAMSHDAWIPFGRFSRGQLARTLDTKHGMSIFMGQTYKHRWHMVHIHTQWVPRISSSNPRADSRRNFRGSIPSRPVAGQPEEHAPHVRQRFRLPFSGRSRLTSSKNDACFFLPSLINSPPTGRASCVIGYYAVICRHIRSMAACALLSLVSVPRISTTEAPW